MQNLRVTELGMEGPRPKGCSNIALATSTLNIKDHLQ